MTEETDVVVVGGSIAGSATAIMLARHGARVVVLEKAADPAHHKRMCTHYFQAPAVPVLRRLGLEDAMRAAGARDNGARVHTPYGWVDVDAPEGLNLRRSVLDPLLRGATSGEPGVDYRGGVTVTAVEHAPGGRVRGVRGRRPDGTEVAIDAKVVVAADGRGSGVARLANVPGRVRAHGRIQYQAYYRGITPADGRSRFWMLDPDALILFPNDDGISVLGCAVTKDQLPEFRADPRRAIERRFDGVEEAPDLNHAEPVGRPVGKIDMPNVRRPVARPGLAFVGDAAQASDPLWGVGLGFALQGAELLADALGPAIAAGSDPDAALGVYRRRQRRLLLGHHLMMCDYASGRRLNPIERLMMATATHHAPTAQMFAEIGSRERPLQQIMTPPRLARMAVAAARGPRSAQRAGEGLVEVGVAERVPAGQGA